MPYQYLSQQIQEVRRRADEPSAASISTNHIIDLLNQGAYVSTRDLGVYFEDRYGFGSVANQQAYDLPDNYISTSNVLYSPWVNHQPLQEIGLTDLLNPFPEVGIDPVSYAIDLAKRKINVSPMPQTNVITTTLNGALNATDVTIVVVSTTGFGRMGRIDIDNETIEYTGVTATSFTGCTRGSDGTTAATHLTAATVYWQDFIMFYQRRPKVLRVNYITPGTIAITNGSPTVTGTLTNWLNGQNVFSGNYIGFGSYEATSSAETFPQVWYKILTVNSPTSITLTTNFAEPTITSSACIITDKSDLMEAETELPVLFALIQVYDKLGNQDKREKASSTYAYEMQEARRRMNGPDYIPRVKKTIEAIDMNYPLPRLPGNYPSNQGSV